MENEYKINLLKRFITSIGIIVPIILVIMLQNFWVFTVMISIICCLAFYEWATNNLINRYLFGFNLIFLFWFCSVYFVYDYSLMSDDALVQFSKVFSSLSVYDIFLLIVLNTAIFDTVAYIIGSNFGKNYITPRISPNKTFEGLFGGITGSAIFSLIICQVYNLNFWLVLIFISGGIFAFIGDLNISCHKRQRGIKDTGSILPGHGGILDRLDSHLIATPILLILTLEVFILL